MGKDRSSSSTGPVAVSEPIGVDGGEPFGPLDCPAGAVTMATNVNLGTWINSIELQCRTLTLTYD